MFLCVMVVHAAEHPELKRRVALAGALLIGSKLANISVPLFMKAAVDSLTVPGMNNVS